MKNILGIIALFIGFNVFAQIEQMDQNENFDIREAYLDGNGEYISFSRSNGTTWWCNSEEQSGQFSLPNFTAGEPMDIYVDCTNDIAYSINDDLNYWAGDGIDSITGLTRSFLKISLKQGDRLWVKPFHDCIGHIYLYPDSILMLEYKSQIATVEKQTITAQDSQDGYYSILGNYLGSTLPANYKGFYIKKEGSKVTKGIQS